MRYAELARGHYRRCYGKRFYISSSFFQTLFLCLRRRVNEISSFTRLILAVLSTNPAITSFAVDSRDIERRINDITDGKKEKRRRKRKQEKLVAETVSICAILASH